MGWTRARWKAVLLDFLERAGWSAGQVFFATLLAGGATTAGVGLPWKHASVLALSAAVSSVGLTVVQYLTRATNLAFWPDLVVRLAKTFAGSMVASWAGAHVFDITTFDWTTALNVAFLATIGALGKGLLARGPGSPVPVDPSATVAVGRAAVHTNPSTLPTATYLEATRR